MEFGEEFFREHNDAYNLGFSSEMIKVMNLTTSASESELIICYISGYLRLSPKELCEFDISSIYSMLSIDPKRIKEILKLSEEVFSNLDIKLKDYFELELA